MSSHVTRNCASACHVGAESPAHEPMVARSAVPEGRSTAPRKPGTTAAAHAGETPNRGTGSMLHYAIVFFVLALLAALFGFGGIATTAAGIAKLFFIGFVILAVLSLIFGSF